MQIGQAISLPILGVLLGTSSTSEQARPGTATVQSLAEGHRHSYAAGDQWCYRNFQVASGRENRTWIQTIIRIQGDEADIQQIDRVSGKNQEPTVKEWNLQKGLYKGALSVGEKWTELGIGGKDVAGQSETKVVGKEWIDTPIGRLEAFKLENEFSLHAKKYHQVFWFSPDVGNVVTLLYLDKRGRPTQGTEITCFRGAAVSGTAAQ